MRNPQRTRGYSPLARVVVVIKPGGERVMFKNAVSACSILGASPKTVYEHLKSGKPFENGCIIKSGSNSSLFKPAPIKTIPPSEDLPVIAFFRDDDDPIARYKSVTFLQSAIKYSMEIILGWLKGGKEACGDPDCYYKYEKDCTKEELEKLASHGK